MPRPTDPTPAAPETEETNGHKPVSRRGVLKRAAVVAAGAGGASLLLSRKAFAVPTAGNNSVLLTTPARLLDTRSGQNGTSTPEVNARITSNNEITVQATGTGGGAGVPDGATAIFGNVTIATPSASGNLIQYAADGVTEPGANAPVTLVVPPPMVGQFFGNFFTTPLSATGAIDVYWQSSGTTDVIIDVHGYLIDDAAD